MPVNFLSFIYLSSSNSDLLLDGMQRIKWCFPKLCCLSMSATERKKVCGRNILKITQKTWLRRSNLKSVFSGPNRNSPCKFIKLSKSQSLKKEWNGGRPLHGSTPQKNELRNWVNVTNSQQSNPPSKQQGMKY